MVLSQLTDSQTCCHTFYVVTALVLQPFYLVHSAHSPLIFVSSSTQPLLTVLPLLLVLRMLSHHLSCLLVRQLIEPAMPAAAAVQLLLPP